MGRLDLDWRLSINQERNDPGKASMARDGGFIDPQQKGELFQLCWCEWLGKIQRSWASKLHSMVLAHLDHIVREFPNVWP